MYHHKHGSRRLLTTIAILHTDAFTALWSARMENEWFIRNSARGRRRECDDVVIVTIESASLSRTGLHGVSTSTRSSCRILSLLLAAVHLLDDPVLYLFPSRHGRGGGSILGLVRP